MELQGKAILIKPDKLPEKVGSIEMPVETTKKPNSGKVVSVGPGCEEVKLGHRVQYPFKLASIIKIKDEELHFLIEDQILYIDES